MSKLTTTILAFLLTLNINSQTICTTTVAYDYMETFTWVGNWFTPAATAGFYTNASVSPTVSAAIYGSGPGTSAYESDWYVLPNITGLISTHTYKFRFRLASYRFTSTGSGSGTDVGDYITVQLSTNGGVSYVNELRVTGFNNAFWTYASIATASKTASGALTTFSPIAGGDRTSTGDGYSFIELVLPAGTTQVAIDIFCRANATGEEWWIDNIELIEEYTCDPLPVELLQFIGYFDDNTRENIVRWSTASEINNSHFMVYYSYNALDWIATDIITGAGNSNVQHDYSISHKSNTDVTYYKLSQTDYDGTTKYYGPITIFNGSKILEKVEFYDLQGRLIEDVDQINNGIYVKVEYYDDGTIKCKKVYTINE